VVIAPGSNATTCRSPGGLFHPLWCSKRLTGRCGGIGGRQGSGNPQFSLSLFKVLNLKGNSLSGQIPDLTSLLNLKSLFLINNNNFSKNFLDLISSLHRLKIVVLPRNQISSQIPTSLSNSSDCTHCICKTIT